MEVLIYIVLALATFGTVCMAARGENITAWDRFFISFGFGFSWPVIWILFIPVAIMGFIEHLNDSTNAENVLH